MVFRKNLTLTICIFTLVGCHKTYHIPENEILGAWSIGETSFVKLNGRDVTNDFSDYYVSFYHPKLLFFGKMNAVNRYRGEWAWMGSTLKQISLDNGKAFVDVQELTKTSLRATFSFSEECVKTLGIANTFEGDYEVCLEAIR
jgi:hypothetical protein